MLPMTLAAQRQKAGTVHAGARGLQVVMTGIEWSCLPQLNLDSAASFNPS